ncbi:hypothetical protein AMTRI_Chr03g55950 [Amborella trichopoda]
MCRNPEVLWAQRSDKVYVTVALPDAKDISIKSEPHGLFIFSAKGRNNESFDFSLELYGPIVPESNKSNIGLRNILCVIQKKEEGWWPRLVKSDGKPAPYIKVDWNKWCDEDEEEAINTDTLAFSGDQENTKKYEADDESSEDEGLLYLPDLQNARDD